MTKNLTTLLTTDEVSGSEPVSFPDNEEVLKILICEEATTSPIGNIHSSDAKEITKNEINFSYRPNDPIAVVWPINAQLKLYIALFVNKNSNGTLLIDNLEPDYSNKY